MLTKMLAAIRKADKARAWLYRVCLPVEGLAIGYGIIDKSQGVLWLALASAVLTNGSAVVNTSTKG